MGLYLVDVDGRQDKGRSGLSLRGESELLNGYARVHVVDGTSQECLRDADCDDNDRCTEDFCQLGRCAVRSADVFCDDGDPCTIDYCGLDQCRAIDALNCCRSDDECDDADPCTTDTCTNNHCERDRTLSCDDGDPCTMNDTCQSGRCVGEHVTECCSEDEDCDDGKPCTVDVCLPEGCRHQSFVGACDDSDPCTRNDQCDGGVCRGVPVDHCCDFDWECDDSNGCTDDMCEGADCVHAPNSAPCGDGEACVDSQCEGGDCVTTFNTAPCDDGEVCTVNDRCDQGTCRGTRWQDCCITNADCDDDDECSYDQCSGGVCEYFDNALRCDDGDSCTRLDFCRGGECSGIAIPNCCRAAQDCDDGDLCTDEYCLAGICMKLHGTADCDDGDPCTDFDRCRFGECVGNFVFDCCESVLDCDDQDDCTEDACESSRCVNTEIDDCGSGAGLALSGEEPDSADNPGADGVVGQPGDREPGAVDDRMAGDASGSADEPGAGAPLDHEVEKSATSPVPVMCGAVGMWVWMFSLAGLVALRNKRRLT